MSAIKKTKQVTTVKQLIDTVNAYNVAREHELRMMPVGGFPKDYKNVLMENLYDCAELAGRQLKPVLEANLEIGTRI